MTIVRSTFAAALLLVAALPAAAQAPADSDYHDRKSGLIVHSVSEPPANMPTLRTVNPTDRAWVVSFRAPVAAGEQAEWDVGLVLPHDSMSVRVDTRSASPASITAFKATPPASSNFWNLFWEANESAVRNGNGLYPAWVKTDVLAYFSAPVDPAYAKLAADGHKAFMKVMTAKGSAVSPEIAGIVITKALAAAPAKPATRAVTQRAGADVAPSPAQMPAADLGVAAPVTAATPVSAPVAEAPVAAPASAPLTAPVSSGVTEPTATPAPAAEAPATAASPVLTAPTPAPATDAAVEAPRPLAAPVAAPIAIPESALGDTAAFGWRAYARPPVAVISAGSWLFERPMPRYDKRSLTEVGAQSIMDVVIGAAPNPAMDRGVLLREWINRWNAPTGDWIEEQVVTRANEAPAPAPARGAHGKAAAAAHAHVRVADLKALFAANGREAIRLLDDVLGLVQETP